MYPNFDNGLYFVAGIDPRIGSDNQTPSGNALGASAGQISK